ncbi:MAG: phage tail tube protein [Pseudomonadota bacterium]
MAQVAKNGTHLLEYSTDDTTYTPVPGVRSFNPGDMQAEQLDATDFDSPGGQREFINGLIDASDGSFEMHWDPTNAVHQALMAAAGGASLYLRFQMGASRRVKMLTNIISVATPSEVGSIDLATVTIRPAQAPTWEDVT